MFNLIKIKIRKIKLQKSRNMQFLQLVNTNNFYLEKKLIKTKKNGLVTFWLTIMSIKTCSIDWV